MNLNVRHVTPAAAYRDPSRGRVFVPCAGCGVFSRIASRNESALCVASTSGRGCLRKEHARIVAPEKRGSARGAVVLDGPGVAGPERLQ